LRAESIELEPRELEVRGANGVIRVSVLDTSHLMVHIVVYFVDLIVCMMLEHNCSRGDVGSAVRKGRIDGVVFTKSIIKPVPLSGR
jgi:hypothetical protein